MRRARRGVSRARHPAHRGPYPIALPDLSRRPVLQGQVTVQTNVAASFPWSEGGGVDGPHGFGEEGNPGGYFHMSPGEAYVGGGMRLRRAPRSRPSAMPSSTILLRSAPSSTIRASRVGSAPCRVTRCSVCRRASRRTIPRRICSGSRTSRSVTPRGRGCRRSAARERPRDSFETALPVMRWLASL